MSETNKSMADVDAEIKKIFKVGQVIDQKLDVAKASGNKEEYDLLINELRQVKEREEFLQNESSLLELESKKPKEDRKSVV
jgi:hypothetical protein